MVRDDRDENANGIGVLVVWVKFIIKKLTDGVSCLF